jgi:regulator of PEP synthase PpsR (kinase-PPPase family)
MQVFHLHLVSDSTGGTLSSLAKACLAQFDGVRVEQHFWPLVRSIDQLQPVFEGMKKNPGPILYTVVDEAVAARIEQERRTLRLPALSILQPALDMLSATFGQRSLSEPGLQHRLSPEYFARMEAVDYALHHDDGQKTGAPLSAADVILVGVSRTSKTPTCIYLAHRGIKAANIPLVPGIAFPDAVLSLPRPLFVGLTVAAERLVDIRKTRMTHLGEVRETDYLAADAVREEIRSARQFFSRNGWPVIDVTRRSVEETAAEIITLLDQHRSKNAH